jgi:hypothetical protein
LELPAGGGPFLKTRIPIGYFTDPPPEGHSFLTANHWTDSTGLYQPNDLNSLRRLGKRMARVIEDINDLSNVFIPPL